MKIKKASEPILISQIKALLFGQPGAGKSSLALTAEKPLLLDFDKGSYRAVVRADTVEINQWTDVVDLLDSKEELKEYRTLVVDTAGKCLDMLALHIISENSKLAGSGGALTLQGYGVRKAYFKTFLDRACDLGLDVVLVAHDKEEKIEDAMKVRPDVGGSSYADIMKEIDLCGYVEIVKGVRTLNFNPSERAIGKNCAGFPPMKSDSVTMAGLIAEAKRILNERNAANTEVLVEIEELKTKVANIKTIDDANAFLTVMEGIETDIIKQQIRKVLTAKTIELGLKYDVGTSGFIVKPPVVAEQAAPAQ